MVEKNVVNALQSGAADAIVKDNLHFQFIKRWTNLTVAREFIHFFLTQTLPLCLKIPPQ